MTFKEAQTQLKSMLPPGAMHSMRYELTNHHDGTTVVECSVYTPGHGWVWDQPDWATALKMMQARIDGIPVECNDESPE